MLDRLFLRKKLEEFLLEDIGYRDLTTDSITAHKPVQVEIIAKEELIVAGVDFAIEVFKLLDSEAQFFYKVEDGTRLKFGDPILIFKAMSNAVLKGERTALNILQRLSGIATTTRKYVKQLEGTNTVLLDTRKTTPGFRAFEKYAVNVGGAKNHRFALYDMVMIKDNHIALVGSIKEIVSQIKKRVSPMVKIEIEVANLSQLQEAIETDVDIIMLDNMSLDDIKKAVEINNGMKKLEVSGNITIDNIRQVAETGVDFISSGALIHSSRWVDISLRIKGEDPT